VIRGTYVYALVRSGRCPHLPPCGPRLAARPDRFVTSLNHPVLGVSLTPWGDLHTGAVPGSFGSGAVRLVVETAARRDWGPAIARLGVFGWWCPVCVGYASNESELARGPARS